MIVDLDAVKVALKETALAEGCIYSKEALDRAAEAMRRDLEVRDGLR